MRVVNNSVLFYLEVIPIPSFKNPSDLEKHLKKQIKSVMETEILEQIVETESEAIEKTVYSVYKPKVYDRRRDIDYESSLANPDNIKGEVDKNGVLRVHNDTQVNSGWNTSNSGLLAPIIKSGDKYDYQGDGTGSYLKPRDFEAETVKELENSDKLEQAMKKGLQRQGIKAEIK